MKNIILVLLNLVSTLVLIGQEADNELSFEISYGININDVYQHEFNQNFPIDLSPILFGAAIRKKISNLSSISLEMEYSHKGGKSFDINYLTISPSYYLSLNAHSWRIEIGPYLGYLFKYKFQGMEVDDDRIKDFDYGSQLGLSKRIRIEDQIFHLSAQWELGLYEFSASKHNVIQFKLGYQL